MTVSLAAKPGEIPCNIDGEPMSDRNVSFRIIPEAVDVSVPAPEEVAPTPPGAIG